ERGATVYGVEPNPEMREAAETWLHQYPKFKSIAEPAEQTGLPPAKFDMVCAATAFHWFDPVLAKKEWSRILKSGGLAFLVWNVRRELSPFLADYESMLHKFGIGYAGAKHRNTEEASGMTAFFTPTQPRTISFPNEQRFDLESLTGRLMSSSYAPLEGHPDHQPMLEELRIIFEKHQCGGEIVFEYDTKAYFGKLH